MPTVPNVAVAADRSALADVAYAKSYDPSAALRNALFIPNPVTVSSTTDISSTDPNTSITGQSMKGGSSNVNPTRSGATSRIPKVYYPLYSGKGSFRTQPNPSESVAPNLEIPNINEPQYPSNEFIPYAQPFTGGTDPYGLPYSTTPYLVPINTIFPHMDPMSAEQSASDLIAAHQQDADLNRLEVYHFTPKQSPSVTPAPPLQPSMAYQYVFQPPPTQPPPYSHPWYAYPPYAPTYPSRAALPMLERMNTIAQGSQTDEVPTKTRAVSPMRFSLPPINDYEGRPYVHHKTAHTDRYNLPTARISRRVYSERRPAPTIDCRCLDCQQDRRRMLNYYPE